MILLPNEILIKIGLLLNQVNQKTCSLVCKAWQKPFQALVFQKVILVHEEQLDSYLNQDASLRKLAIQLHFNVPLTDEMLEECAQSSPHVNTLTLFINMLNNLSIPKTVSTIRTYWFKNLIKIRMDELLLPEVLPLLSHQLQDVTGGFAAFFNENRHLIPMPELRILDIEKEEEMDYANVMSAKQLDDMRIAYPKLQELTISHFFLDPVDNEDTFVFTPFPSVRSFHLLNCNDEQDSFSQIKKMFTDLTQFSFLRMNVSRRVKEDPYPYENFTSEHANLHTLRLLYLGEMANLEGFPVLKNLKGLTSFHLERSIGTDIITKRELLDFDLLINSAPHLRRLRIYGLFHISSGESFDHYLCGTVGFCDRIILFDQFQNIDGNTIRSSVGYKNQLNPEEDFLVFGDGEELYKSKDRIMTVKKRMPDLKDDATEKEGEVILPAIYDWDERPGVLERVPPMGSITSTSYFYGTNTIYPLTTLCLEWTTIRNPTYQWIIQHLPSLEEFYIYKTEPYPFMEIHLGRKVRTFHITFDDRYTKFDTPIVNLCYDKVEEDVVVHKYFAWTSKLNQFKQLTSEEQQLGGINMYTYTLDIRYTSSLTDLQVCDHSMLQPLEVLKKAAINSL